jgi:hypothetical protein
MLCVIVLSVDFIYYNAQCYYAEYRYAECRGAHWSRANNKKYLIIEGTTLKS